MISHYRPLWLCVALGFAFIVCGIWLIRRLARRDDVLIDDRHAHGDVDHRWIESPDVNIFKNRPSTAYDVRFCMACKETQFSIYLMAEGGTFDRKTPWMRVDDFLMALRVFGINYSDVKSNKVLAARIAELEKTSPITVISKWDKSPEDIGDGGTTGGERVFHVSLNVPNVMETINLK